MKPLVLILLIIFNTFVAFTQAPNIQWAKCYGGSRTEYANSIIQDRDGNFVFGGQSFSANGDVTDHHGGIGNTLPDFWIVKLNDTGKLLWERSYGGTNGDGCNKIIQTNDGNYIAVGTTFSHTADAVGNHDTTKPPLSGTGDILVIKIATNGLVLWEKCYGGTNNEYGYDIQQTNDNGYIIAGTASSTDGDVKGMHNGSGGIPATNMWVVKIDDTGKLQWQKCLGGSYFDQALAIRQTKSNNYIVCGGAYSTDGDITRPLGNGDAWVVKLDDTGTIIWQRTLGGSDFDIFSSIVLNPEGNYVFAGSTRSNDSMVSGNHLDTAGKPTEDAWIVKTDTDGNILWQKLYGGSGTEIVNDVKLTIDSGFILNSSSTSNDGDVHFNYDADSGYVDDMWVLRLDANGDTLWSRVLGGTGYDGGNSIAQTSDSFYVAAGVTSSRDHDVTGNRSANAAWVVRLSNKLLPAAVSQPYAVAPTMTIYPNPSRNNFVLQYCLPGDANMDITDISGKVIYKVSLLKNSKRATINAERWPPGMYFYKVMQNGKVLYKGKLLKE